MAIIVKLRTFVGLELFHAEQMSLNIMHEYH